MKITIVIIVLIVLGIGAYFLMSKDVKKSGDSYPTTTQNTLKQPPVFPE